MDIRKVWEKAGSLRGCLTHRRKNFGRRRHDQYDSELFGDDFFTDFTAILQSKTYRTLQYKTQVFTKPENPLIRTRLAHVNEVMGIAVAAAKMLGLNVELTLAAAAGHDVGHVPLGHQGEAWMAKAMGRPEFCHEVMGPIITQKIERKGRGLNLHFETLEAMMCHSGDKAREGMTQEAWVLRHTDKFAYIFADYNDIVGRLKYPASSELRALMTTFGQSQRERTKTAFAGLIIESEALDKVSFEQSELGRSFQKLRKLMYEVYPRVTEQNVEATMEPLLHFLQQLDLCDPFLLLALMNDEEALMLAAEPMKDMRLFNRTGLSEIVPYLQEIGPIDLCDPNLDW